MSCTYIIEGLKGNGNRGRKERREKKRATIGSDHPFQNEFVSVPKQVHYSKSDTKPQAVNWQKTAKTEGFQRFTDLVMDSNKSAKTEIKGKE